MTIVHVHSCVRVQNATGEPLEVAVEDNEGDVQTFVVEQQNWLFAPVQSLNKGAMMVRLKAQALKFSDTIALDLNDREMTIKLDLVATADGQTAKRLIVHRTVEGGIVTVGHDRYYAHDVPSSVPAVPGEAGRRHGEPPLYERRLPTHRRKRVSFLIVRKTNDFDVHGYYYFSFSYQLRLNVQ